MSMIAGVQHQLRQSRYLRDVLWQMSGNGLAQLVGLVAMPLLTRLYAPADFASLNLFSQVVAGLTIVLTWRFEYLVMLPKDDAQAQAILRVVAIAGASAATFVTLVAWLGGRKLAVLLGDTALAPWLLLAPVTAWLICLSIGLQQAVQRRQDFRNAGLSEVMNKGGYVVSSLAGVPWLPHIGGLMSSAAVGAGAKSLWLWRTLHVEAKVPSEAFVTASDAIKPYRRLAGSMSFSNLLAMITSAAPMIFIAKVYGSDALGQFGLVVSTLYLPSGLLGNAIGQVYYQRAAQRHAQGKAFDDLWRTTAWQLARIGVLLYAGIALLSPWAYPILFGNQWHAAGQYATLMAVAAGFSFVTSPLDRTSLIVHAWLYLPLWHTARALTTVAVVWMAWRWDWSVLQFLRALVMQMSSMYLADWLTGRWFAMRRGSCHA